MEKTKSAGFDQVITSQLPKGKKILFGIGINAYQSHYWPKLNNAVRDVEQLARLLTTHYGFDQVRLLRDAEATSVSIEDELYRFTDANVIGPDDSLLIYYSGHGHLDKNERGYWVPVDAEKDKIATYLPNSRIRELISDIKCRHILLVSDACFSGSFFVKGVRSSIAEVEVAEEYEKRVSRWAFCSGRQDEVVSDGKPGEHSPFAGAILQELTLNTTRKLNIARLADKVIEITRSNYRQMPEANPIQDAGHKGGQFVFTPEAREGGMPVPDPIPEPVPQPSPYRPPQPIPEPVVETLVEPQPKLPFWQNPRMRIVAGIMLLMACGWVLLRRTGYVTPPEPEQATLQLLSNPFNRLDTIEYGQTAPIPIRVKNTGNLDARLKSIELANPDLALSGNRPKLIAPQAEDSFSVQWKPRYMGLQQCEMVIRGYNLKDSIRIWAQVYVKEKVVNPAENITDTGKHELSQDKSKSKINVEKDAKTDATKVISDPPGPMEKPVVKEETTILSTDIPVDVKMWLVTDSKKRYDAKIKDGMLVFEIPANLKGKSVQVYFKRNGEPDWKRLRIGHDEITLPPGI